MTLDPELITKTYAAIKPATMRTPTVHAARLSLHLDIDLYLKLENLQHTNALGVVASRTCDDPGARLFRC